MPQTVADFKNIGVSIAQTFFKASKHMCSKAHRSLRIQNFLCEKLSVVRFLRFLKRDNLEVREAEVNDVD